MNVVSFYESAPCEQEYLLGLMKKTDWGAALWLCDLAENGEVRSTFGDTADILLLTDNGNLASYCTLAPQDEIDDKSLTPWAGFVFTFPEYRGRRCAGMLLDEACRRAKEQGFSKLYVSSEEKGLYEKYGFEFLESRQSIHGYETQIFVRTI